MTEISYELYIHPWSFRKIKGSAFTMAFNNETKLMCHGYLTKYLDGEVIFKKLDGERILVRDKQPQKDFTNELRFALT